MRTIIWFAYFWLYLLWIYPKQKYFQRRKKLEVFNDEDLKKVDNVASSWAGNLLSVAGVSCTVDGLDNIPKGKPVLFTANHQGYFDIPLMITHLDKPHPLIAKKSLEELPFISKWMELFDCLFIDREDARQTLKIFARAEELISEGKSVIIFPEGTRSKQAEAGEFKAGAFKIATKIGAPVVPVAINGSYKVMEANNMRIHPATVKITILPPIETKDLSKDEIKHLGIKVRDQIMDCNANSN